MPIQPSFDAALIERLPTVLAVPFREFAKATDSEQRLHRLCDAAEVLDGTGGLWADLCRRQEPEEHPGEAVIAAAGRLPYGLKELPADKPGQDAATE